MDQWLAALPKTELHVHIEGTLEPELMFELAQRNGIHLPWVDVAGVRAAYQFHNLQSFLDLYYAGASVLQTEDDFYQLAMAYFRRAVADGVKHCEVFFDPQTHTDRGIEMATVIHGLARAASAIQAESGLSVYYILCFLRHLSAESAMQTLLDALPYRQHFVGVGLDSSEVGNPPERFEAVFEQARLEGLPRVAHAGEEGPPEYIWQALDLLRVARIDHGVRAEEDPHLMQRLHHEQIPLTVCPLSNLKLKVVDDLRQHNLKRLLEAGLCVTVNSDDPAYFGGYVLDNYRAVATALGLSRENLYNVARNGFIASFLPEAEKAHWLAILAQYWNDTADSPVRPA